MKEEHKARKEKLREVRKRLKRDATERAHILDILSKEKVKLIEDDTSNK